MRYLRALSNGFVFKELFITLAVVIGLFAIAYPAWRDYMRRDYYKAVVEATAPFKVAVEKCFSKLKVVKGCDAGSYSIPAAIKTSHGALASIDVIDGVIIATPVAQDGIRSTDRYILTPKIVNDEIVWVPSGDGLTHGYTG